MGKIITVNISDIKETPHNPRQITKKDFEKLKKSLEEDPEFLEAREIVVDENMVVLGGNQRLKALKSLGKTEIEVKQVTGWSEAKKRRFVIKDNIQNGDWDMDELANHWDDLPLDEWIDEVKPYKEIVEGEPAPVDNENTYSLVGDIYQLGEHRIFCGSFDDEEKVRELFGDKKATCTFTDPPYNVAYTSADGKSIKNDSMAHEDFLDFLSKAFDVVAKNTITGGGVISWMSNKELFTLWDAYQRAGLKFRQLIVWVKDRFTLGHADFQYATEPAIYGMNEGSYDKDSDSDEGEGMVAIYARGNGKFQNNRKLSNTWFFEKPTASKDHPTMKPVALCAKGVIALSEPGDIVFDPFSGSGSTMIACEQTGRKCYGCEIDPKYCDVIRKRYWKFKTGSEEGWQDGTRAIN